VDLYSKKETGQDSLHCPLYRIPLKQLKQFVEELHVKQGA
jgi:hypothetical protein